MSGSFNDAGELEISDGRLIFCTGKKKSGKSVMGKLIFQSYPGDRVIIDPAGDDGPFGPGVIELKGDIETLPDTWPEWMREYDKNNNPLPMTLRYFPDAGSPTLLADCDKVIGMCIEQSDRLKKQDKIGVLILIHEIGDVCPENRTQPNMRRVLAHNRHHHLSMISCGPRPKKIDALLVQQSDILFVFELMNPDDRKRVAECIGWNPREFDEAMSELQVNQYLRVDTNEPKPAEGEDDMRVLHFDALPMSAVHTADREIPAHRT